MSKRLVVLMVALIAELTFSLILRAQTAPPKWNNVPPPKSEYVGKKSGPAPRRDLSGIWNAPEAARGQGVEGGRPDETGILRPLHYTPLGLEALKANKPSGPGVRQVPAALANDPADLCDPLGFPYMEFWEFRTIDVVQTAKQVVLLSPFYGNYRVIWTDGRELPTDPDPRWNGYSVGKWVDDYTFVVETVGLNPRSWLDHAGRPHSDALRVEERFHRVDHDNMELTVTIDDPKMYTEPWQGLVKFPLHLQRPDFDIPELLCSPSEMAEYNKQIGSTVLPKSPK
jgi:hypothetical protein